MIGVVALTLATARTSDAAQNQTRPTTRAAAMVSHGGGTGKGGTIRILEPANFEYLDPAELYSADEADFGRLFLRTLTIVDDTPGRKPTIKPDIARDTGTPSDGDRTWTFRLRHGVTYEDGSPVTSADIKYAVERTFASDVLPGVPPYLPVLLANPDHYAGPYKDPNKDLAAVQTPDPYTIVFHFAAPQPDAPWMMSMATAPVPKAKDDGRDYTLHPVASGPYRIDSYSPNKSITLVRNPKWNPATDPHRPALPDRYEVTFGIDRATISQRLIADRGEDRNALTLFDTLQGADIPKLGQPSVKRRVVTGSGHAVLYIVFNELKIKDLQVRKAIALAINRQAVLTAQGGPAFGSLTNTIIPEGIAGRNSIDLGLKPTGDPVAAAKALNGTPVPTLHFGVSSTSTKQKAIAAQVQSDLKAIGINVVIDEIPTDSYSKTLHNDDKAPDLFVSGFQPDWPTAAAIIPAVLGPDASGTKWVSTNLARYYDPTTSGQIAELASSSADPAQVGKQFNDLTNQVLSTNWPMLPVVESRNLQVVGSNIRNAGLSTLYSQIDLLRVGVRR
ncbi:ABC transporter substrate-binding protein [Fodinicola feengrottensis]|uniref:ABC transporter substrate-binding protein n=1 Tax=Fodinicola feengrottensis TaxID=435914 RepID=A0ABN2IDF8_9ACTN